MTTTIDAAIGASTVTAQASTGAAPVAGPREFVPFGFTDIAAGDNATPASSTPVVGTFCGVAGQPAGATMLRPGSLTGISVDLSEAATGSVAIFGVYKNGTIFNILTVVSIPIAGVTTKGYATFTPGTYTFVPNDVVDVRVRTGSGWLSPNADANVLVEIETAT